MTDALAPWLSATLGLPEPITVARIGTGHSRAMSVATAADGRRVVVRAEQGGVFGTSGAEECRVMRALHAAGYPVAAILAEDASGTVAGDPLFVMEFVEGAEVADERALDAATAAAFVGDLHRLHQLDGRDFGFDIVPREPNEATPLQIERWRDVYRGAAVEPIPLLEEAAAWLLHHAPPLDRLAVVHGDAGPGNFVHRDGRVVAVTDWEFAHLGDPAEDWAYCLAMRGSRTMPREQWLELFADHAGFTMEEERWRYWEAFNLFKGACANRTCLRLFETGRNPRPNMAIIGTALHQVFLRRLVSIVHG
jgi:aminoglycoside phosphotransferase (APT) family kinase protein